MLAFSKWEAARVATEMSYYAAKRPQNDVHKLKLRNVVSCLHLANSKLQRLQQKSPIMLQSDLRTMSRMEAPFFLLQALSDLVVQSPMNKMRPPIHHLQHNTQTPERTTAIPPARIAVLIQAKKQQQNTRANKTENAKKCEISSQWLTCTQLTEIAHSDYRSSIDQTQN